MRKFLFVLLTLIFLTAGISALCNDGQININSASLEELEKIIWVGDATSQRIIDYRNTNTFDSVDELIEIAYIGESKLADIKEEGLACVGEQEETEKEIQEETEEQPTEEVQVAKITSNEIQETPNKEVETITLIPKDIKSEIDKEQLSKNKLAIYCLVIFCILLAFLFIIKKRKERKNEFR